MKRSLQRIWHRLAGMVLALGLLVPVGAHAAMRAELDTASHRLVFYDGDTATQTFRVRLGLGGVGKCRTGDKRTPIGRYMLSPARKSSDFRWFLAVSYPNADDRAKGCTGGDIGLHGTGNKLRRKLAHNAGFDWTLGCIAVTNKEIDAIRALVTAPTPLTIRS